MGNLPKIQRENDMDNEFSTERTTTERVVIGALIVLGMAILLGIQSLFLNHIADALPQDSLWRMVTIACFLAPPIAFSFLVLLKLNFSRSTAQDYILIGGMSLELVLFVINLVVAVNARQIEGTMLGIIGVLLGGAAGVISAATTAYALSADPLRGVAKARIQHGLKVEKKAQQKTEGLIDKAMGSERVLAKAEAWAENYVTERLGQTFARRVNDGAPSQKPPAQPTQVELTPETLAELLAMLQAGNAPANGGTHPKP
jgi:hypothetical protein